MALDGDEDLTKITQLTDLMGTNFDTEYVDDESKWKDFFDAVDAYCENTNDARRKDLLGTLIAAIPNEAPNNYQTQVLNKLEKIQENFEKERKKMPADLAASMVVKTITGWTVSLNPKASIQELSGKKDAPPEAFWDALERFWTAVEKGDDLNEAAENVSLYVEGDKPLFVGWSPQQKVRYLTKMQINQDLTSSKEVQDARRKIGFKLESPGEPVEVAPAPAPAPDSEKTTPAVTATLSDNSEACLETYLSFITKKKGSGFTRGKYGCHFNSNPKQTEKEK